MHWVVCYHQEFDLSRDSIILLKKNQYNNIIEQHKPNEWDLSENSLISSLEWYILYVAKWKHKFDLRVKLKGD